MSLYGYARVSTDGQSLDQQHAALVEYGVDPENIVMEVTSGGSSERVGLDAVLDALVHGDELVVAAIDRLARDTLRSAAVITDLYRRGVVVRCLREGVDSASPSGRMFMTVLSAVAEYEREIGRERTRVGILAARARGAVPGRRPVISEAQLAEALRRVDQGERVTEVAASLGVGRSTLYRALAEVGD